MIKEMTGEYGFYGNGYPQIIMTDDDAAERNALQKVFPHTKLLLCLFHFLQVCKHSLSHTYKYIHTDNCYFYN